MGEIIEVIDAKLRDFEDHTESLLGLIKELAGIKGESNDILVRIQQKMKEIEGYQKLIKDLAEEADRSIGEIKGSAALISKELDGALKDLHSLEENINDLQKSANSFFGDMGMDIAEFKEEIRKEIASRIDIGLKSIKEYTEETRTIISRDLTEFLNKQNVMITNLTQQIDSTVRAINTFKIDLEKNSQAIRKIEEQVGTLREEIKGQKESETKLKHEIDELWSSNQSMAKELRGLKSKLSDTQFVKKFGIGYVLVKKKED